MRKSHEETAAANSIRFEQIQKHFEHVDGRVDKIYEVIKHNCGKGLLESDSEMKSPTGAAK
ncbi:MAG: hypothetical protein EHM42_15950 [Planctomycetaceae bacterium]|nr:MAG: hypothetical protein EHM42_15950 [Planctomycetaceae bacterium]